MRVLFAFSLLLASIILPSAAPESGPAAPARASSRKLAAQPTTTPAAEADGGTGDGDISGPSDGQGCFSPLATVQVRGKGSVTMRHLQIGDEIMTTATASASSSSTYQPVYAFGHYETEKTREFLQIFSVSSNNNNNHQAEALPRRRPLEITEQHLVYLEGKVHPVRADSIQEGDILVAANGGSSKVTKIRTIERQGYYAPLVPNGRLLVDDIQVSSYISLQKDAVEFVEFQGARSSGISQHDLVHMILSPFRMTCRMLALPSSSPSASSWAHNNNNKICHSYDENGMPYFVSFGLQFAAWVHVQNVLVQSLVFIGFMLVFGSFLALESILLGAAAAVGAPIIMSLMMILVTVFPITYFCMKKVLKIKVCANKVKTV